MPNSIPPTLAELEICRETIVRYMSEVKNIADGAAKELRTLQAALEHVEQMIKDYRSGDSERAKLSRSEQKSTAA
jgi:hypothetical protein